MPQDSKSRSPAFQYYPRDTLMNPIIAVMSNEEFGAYWKLVSYIWLEEFLLYDERKLARLLGVPEKKFRKLWVAMEQLFVIDDNKITHPELDQYRQKQAEWREKSRLGGQKSVEGRSKGGSNLVETNDEPNSNQTSTLHLHTASASSSSSTTSHTNTAATDATSMRVASKHSNEIIDRYAKDNKLGAGWKTKARRTGEWDADIDDSLRPKPVRMTIREELEQKWKKEEKDAATKKS